MKFKTYVKESKKSHFVYQANLARGGQEIVHRGTEQSSKDWIVNNSRHFDHKGKNFHIYKKPKGRGVRLSDRLDFRHVHKEETNPRIPRKPGQPAGSRPCSQWAGGSSVRIEPTPLGGTSDGCQPSAPICSTMLRARSVGMMVFPATCSAMLRRVVSCSCGVEHQSKCNAKSYLF